MAQADVQTRLLSGLIWLTQTQQRTDMADTNKAEQRLNKLVELIWATRWVSEESDYQDLVGMAAAIRSGNFDGIDKAIADGQAKAAVPEEPWTPIKAWTLHITNCKECKGYPDLCKRGKQAHQEAWPYDWKDGQPVRGFVVSAATPLAEL
jgi:hypothetical protein